MVYSYDFANVRRDLSDVLSTVIADAPRFISAFQRAADAQSTKHEWLEDQIAGRSIVASAVSGMNVTVSATDAAKVRVGTLLNIKGDSAVFKVTAVSGTSVTVALAGANGSKKAAPAASDVLEIISTPSKEGSTSGENTFHQSGAEYNYTQIIRKDVVLTGTSVAINAYGVENAIDRQTQFALQEMTRDLNRMAVRGVRVAGTAADERVAGGLYYFGTTPEGIAVPLETAAKLDSYIINDAAQAVLGAGGDPSMILCSPGQARVLSAELKDQIQILREDTRRGAYVAVVINDITGRGMTIMADPDMPDTDVFVCDPAGFGISFLKGRGITDEDTTAKGFDGIQRTVMGEFTFEFKNAKQRICRISNLTPSAAALAALRK